MEIQQSINDLINRDLITIQKPGRYIGGEYNQIKKEWSLTSFHVALAFPDIYDIGFPNLGIASLYNIINSRTDALAERVFAPWNDMEALLREKELPLFSLESKVSLGNFDLIGFSLPYETLYTNVLNMLDLSSIQIYSKDRSETDPIIIAGGHATYNPEPMHAFIDAFVIGEGEEIINEIIDLLISLHDSSREEKIHSLNEISGIYVPALRQTEKSDSQQNKTSIYPSIKKRFIKKIDSPIQNLLVPNISVVHDRIAIEIMRGCSRGCRFCQAGMIMRPVREMSYENVIATVKDSLEKTGITEFSLLSLSTSDHSQISEILKDINDLSHDYQIDFSLPSLRIESFDQKLMDTMESKRKGNFTIAPEAGSEERRSAINKPIPLNDILNTVEQICIKGWNNIKLYFMIGFPGETDADIESIVNLCRDIKKIGNKILKGKFKLHVSINTLIPKSHTPYQWAPLATKETIEKKYQILRDGLRPLKIKLNYPDYDLIQLEALLSRGDRELSNVIFAAWKKGAKFDAWREGFSSVVWNETINKSKLSLDKYLFTEKDLEEPLAWDFINTGINKSFLKQEFLNSSYGKTTPGCFQKCSACGIMENFQINCTKTRIGEE